jgi:hypothetical protein
LLHFALREYRSDGQSRSGRCEQKTPAKCQNKLSARLKR